MALENELKS